MSTAKKSNPALWKRIVAAVKAGTKGGRAGQWSARKAQLAVARYKKAGGGYRGAKKKSNKLSKWTKQKVENIRREEVWRKEALLTRCSLESTKSSGKKSY